MGPPTLACARRYRRRVIACGLALTSFAFIACGGSPSGSAWPPDDQFIEFDQMAYTLDTATQHEVTANVLVYGSDLPEFLTVQLHLRDLDSFEDLSEQSASVRRVGYPPYVASFVLRAPTDARGNPVPGPYMIWASWQGTRSEQWVNAGFFVK